MENSKCSKKGEVTLSLDIVLRDVLYVPNLTCNLILVGQLFQDLNCDVIFQKNYCLIQDHISRRLE